MKSEPNLMIPFKSEKLSLMCKIGKLKRESIKMNMNKEELNK